MESAQPEGAEVEVPFAVVDLDQADVLLAQGLADVDPLFVPADPAIAADAADLKVARILQWREASWVGSRGRGIECPPPPNQRLKLSGRGGRLIRKGSS
jgi:hypothetical protein